jgi:hypothetical protein
MKTKDRNINNVEHRWLVLLRPDGVVEAVDGGAPVTWVGHRLTEIADIPESLKSAASELARSSPDAGYVHRRTTNWVQRERDVEIALQRSSSSS